MSDHTLGGRLRRAIKDSGRSIRGFQREMEAKEVPGSSYPMVHRYLKGDRDPGLEFLRESASLLGVRLEWLLGDGPMTEEAARRAAIETAASSRVGKNVDLVTGWVALGMGLPKAPRGGSHTPGWLAPTIHLFTERLQGMLRAWDDQQPDVPHDEREAMPLDERSVAMDVGRSIVAPLEALGLHVDDLSEFELRNYVMASVATLLPIAHHHNPTEGGSR